MSWPLRWIGEGQPRVCSHSYKQRPAGDCAECACRQCDTGHVRLAAITLANQVHVWREHVATNLSRCREKKCEHIDAARWHHSSVELDFVRCSPEGVRAQR